MHHPIEFSSHALAQAIEQCPVSVVITDLSGRIEYVNAWFTRVTGYTREEAVGKNPRVLKSGYTTEEEYEKMFAELLEGKIWTGEFQNRRKNGQLYWEEAVIVPVTDADGQRSHYMALKEDVTARKAAERAQEAMIALLELCNAASSRQELLQNAANHFRDLTKAASVTLWSGTAKGALKSMSVTAGSEPAEGEQATEWILPMVQSGTELGKVRFVMTKRIPLGPADERLCRQMVDAVTIALAKFLADEALLESQQRLRDMEKMEAMGQLAGGVAHDYNNILTATLLHLAMLQEMPDLPAEVRETLDELEQEAKRATKLTRQLLLFSRRQPVRFGPVDVQSLVGNLYAMLSRVVGEDVRFEVPQKSVEYWVDGDAGMLEQVVMNLCLNARDSLNSHGGTIHVSLDSVRLGKLERHRNPKARPGPYVCLRVRDNGCGMDSDTQTRIFEPFYTTKGEGRGTGLGLSTVYGIVERHQGWIEVDSEVGQGTEFRVYFPQREGTLGEKPAASQATLARGNGELILLAEDDPMVRATFASALRLHGFHVLDVPDGPSAVRAWERKAGEISLLITDMVMPGGLSGPDLINRIRLDNPALPVVIMTGYGAEREGAGVSSLSGVSQVSKPCELHVIVETVAGRLNKEGVTEI